MHWFNCIGLEHHRCSAGWLRNMTRISCVNKLSNSLIKPSVQVPSKWSQRRNFPPFRTWSLNIPRINSLSVSRPLTYLPPWSNHWTLLSEKIWHDLRTNFDSQCVRPHTTCQWIALVLHLSLLIAFVLPCIAAQGHITNLPQINFSTIAARDPALLTKFLLISLQFISTVRVKTGFICVPAVTLTFPQIYCIALLAVTAQLHNKEWAPGFGNINVLWRLRIGVYFILTVTLNAVMATVIQVRGTQKWYRDRPSINTYNIRVCRLLLECTVQHADTCFLTRWIPNL